MAHINNSYMIELTDAEKEYALSNDFPTEFNNLFFVVDEEERNVLIFESYYRNERLIRKHMSRNCLGNESIIATLYIACDRLLEIATDKPYNRFTNLIIEEFNNLADKNRNNPVDLEKLLEIEHTTEKYFCSSIEELEAIGMPKVVEDFIYTSYTTMEEEGNRRLQTTREINEEVADALRNIGYDIDLHDNKYSELLAYIQPIKLVEEKKTSSRKLLCRNVKSGLVIKYGSIAGAARDLSVSDRTIFRALKDNSLVLKVFEFKYEEVL